MSNTIYDVVIIGAGFAGLSCAAHLPADRNLRVLIVDARARVGGRAHVAHINDQPINLGCCLIHNAAGNPLLPLAKEAGTALIPTAPSDGARLIFDPDGQIDDEQAERVIGVFLRAAYVELPQADSLPDDLSAGDYLRSFGRKMLKEEEMPLFEMAARFYGAAFGELDDLSAKWRDFARRLPGGSEFFVAGGYKSVIHHLKQVALAHQNTQLRLYTPIEQLHDEGNHVRLVTNAGDSIRARKVVCTMPLGVLKAGKITFEPPLPRDRLGAIERVGLVAIDTVVLTYETTWWEIDSYRAFTCFAGIEPLPQAATALLYSHPEVHVLWFHIGGADALAVAELSDKEVTQWAHKLTSAHVPRKAGHEPSKPVNGFATRWSKEPFTLGSYSYLPKRQKGQETACSPLDLIEMSRPLYNDKLMFAGEHTEVDHHGTAHGAYLSGQREAKRIEALLQAEDLMKYRG